MLVPDADDLQGQAAKAVNAVTMEMNKTELISLLTECLRYEPGTAANDVRPSSQEVLQRLSDILRNNGGDPRDMKNKQHKSIIRK